MKERKKFRYGISILLVLMFALIPFGSAFAEIENVLRGKLPHTSKGVSNYSYLNDGDNKTKSTIGPNASIIYMFDDVFNMQSYDFYGTNSANLEIYFYSENNQYLGYKPLNTTGLIDYSLDNVKEVRISNKSTASAYTIDELRIYGTFNTPVDSTPPLEVTNLTETHTDTEVTLNFTHPNDSDFELVKVYQDGVFLKNIVNPSTTIRNLTPGQTYVFKLTTVDTNGNESTGKTITVTMDTPPEPLGEIKDLKANTEHDRVNLSWKTPQHEEFHHVNIYRKQVEKQSFFQMFSARTVSAAETSDGYTLIFETNGTYWNDLTVQPKTTYEYKLTTESTEGIETEGVTIQATTLEEPIPVIEDEKIEEDEQKDYVVSWSAPRTGSIKVLIDGTEYKTVPASDGSLTIPKQDMKYTFLGEPKIKLIPISESGLEGKPIDPEGLEELKPAKLDFGANDLLIISMQLLGWIAPILLISLAIWYQKPLIRLIRKAATYLKRKEV